MCFIVELFVNKLKMINNSTPITKIQVGVKVQKSV